MGGKAPAPPDYRGAAEESALSSREVTEQQTWANRPTQITPFGREDWYQSPVWDPATGQYLNKWVQSTQLNPQSQRALDAEMEQGARKSELGSSMLGRMEDEFGQPMNWNNFSSLQGAPDVPLYQNENIQRGLDYSGLDPLDTAAGYQGRAEDAIYNKGASRLDRRVDQGREAERTRLANQGLGQGDAAYDRAMQDFNEGATDAYGQLNMDAITGSGAEAARMSGIDQGNRSLLGGEVNNQGMFANSASQQALMQQLGIGNQQFDQGLKQSGFQNTLRQQEISEQMQQRGFTLNEINAIMSGQQVGMPSMPGFVNAGKSDSIDYSGAANDQYNAELSGSSLDQAGMQGLMEGGAAMYTGGMV